VDFFYSAAGEPPFAEEIREIASRHPSLHVHLVDTSREGRLTPQRALAAADTHPGAMTVFLSGPQTMVRSFQTQMRRAGVPTSRIHREYFAWR